MRQQSQPLVIMSAYSKREMCDAKENDVLNRMSNVELLNTLEKQGYCYETAEGMYKGTKERSVVIYLEDSPGDTHIQLMSLLDLAARYNQESIMYVDIDRNAYLVYPNGMQTIGLDHGRAYLDKIGTFKRFDLQSAIHALDNLDAYTRLDRDASVWRVEYKNA